MMQPDWDATTKDGDPAHDEAVRICHEGVQIAIEVGSAAELCPVETGATIWLAIVDVAHDLDAGVIISGAHGVTGLRGLFTASISDVLLKNVGRPVLVIPGEKEQFLENF